MGSSPNKDLPLEGRWKFQHFYPIEKCNELNQTFALNGNDMIFRYHPHFSTKERPRYNRFVGGKFTSHKMDSALFDAEFAYFTKHGSHPSLYRNKSGKSLY